MNIKTICIHGSDWQDPTGCISVPIFQSATFGHSELGESTGYDYTRVQNPTRECAEKVVAALEHGCDCTSYSSGMAAISMVMELFKPGDTILSSDDLYGGSIRLFRFVNEKNGIQFKFVNTSHEDKVEEAFDETVKAVYIETPTNPMMQITDIRKTADIAHARGAGAMLSFYTDRHETALKVLKDVKLIRFAESLGGVESLITYPATQTHSDLTEEERQSRGITACLLRLSVGIEDVNDLIADLEQALG